MVEGWREAAIQLESFGVENVFPRIFVTVLRADGFFIDFVDLKAL